MRDFLRLTKKNSPKGHLVSFGDTEVVARESHARFGQHHKSPSASGEPSRGSTLPPCPQPAHCFLCPSGPLGPNKHRKNYVSWSKWREGDPVGPWSSKAGNSLCAVRCRAPLFSNLPSPGCVPGEEAGGGLSGAPGPSPQPDQQFLSFCF